MLLLSKKNTELLTIPESLSSTHTPTHTTNLLAAAGYRLAPAHPNNSAYYRAPGHPHRAKSIGKIPASPRWQQTPYLTPPLADYFTTTDDPQTQTNALIILDPDTLIIDIDTKDGAPGLASFDLLCRDANAPDLFHQAAFAVKTPSGGYHLYFSLPVQAQSPDDAAEQPYIQKKIARYPGIDFLSSRLPKSAVATIGAYAVAPHSSTPYGRYNILPSQNRISPLNPIPAPILPLIQRAPSPEDFHEQPDPADPSQPKNPPAWDDSATNIERGIAVARRYPALAQGDRSHGMFRAGALLRDNLLSPRAAATILWEHLNPRCEPPLEWSEFFTVIKNAYHYAKGKPGNKHPAHIFTSPFIKQLQERAFRESVFPASMDPMIPASHAGVSNSNLQPNQPPLTAIHQPTPGGTLENPHNLPRPDEDPGAWMLEMDFVIAKDGSTRPKPGSFKNAALLIQNIPELKGLLAFNQLAVQIVIRKPSPWLHITHPDLEFANDGFRSVPWTDSDTIQLKGFLERYPLHQLEGTWGTGFTVATLTLREAVQYVAHQSPFHPVRRILRRAQILWDGKPRLDTWIPHYLRAEDTPLNRGISRLLIMAIIVRQFNPGHKFDHMVVWEGEQGIGKSQIGRILALHEDWFSDSAFDMSDSAKVIEAIGGKIVVELAELDQLSRHTITTIKSFITREFDRARLAYAHSVSDNPRQTVFLGTTNESQYLVDHENRRFLPVKITETSLRLDELKNDILQIYGEAMHAFDQIVREQQEKGLRFAAYQLVLPPELNIAAKAEQSSRRILDARTGILRDFLNRKQEMASPTTYLDPETGRILATTARDIAVSMLHLAPSRIDRRSQMDIANMFRDLGWRHVQRTDREGVRQWFYLRPDTPDPFAIAKAANQSPLPAELLKNKA